MQLIATARFQAAFARATATQPYTRKLAELTTNLANAGGGVDHPLLQSRDSIQRTALVVISSGRGLCGGYNTNVLRATIEHLKQQDEAQIPTDIYAVGQKGITYLEFVGREVLEKRTDIDDRPRFDQVEPLANELMRRFTEGEIDAAHVAYTRFYSAGKQGPELAQLLPMQSEPEPDAQKGAGGESQYEFSPDPAQILDELLPATLRVRLFQCFTDASVSEQVARMVAMKAATDAAGDMITGLTRKYNRARQTHITMELLDIVGGANALS